MKVFHSIVEKKFDFRFWLSHKDLAQILAKNWWKPTIFKIFDYIIEVF
jgi:hypothetical protein